MPFRFTRLAIPDVMLIEAQAFGDQRGFFMETYKRSEFEANGISARFAQDNLSHSVRGVLRGLHYQKHPYAQAKLVMALHGTIFDVAVDMRKGSPTYGQWVGTELVGRSGTMLYIPEGFAHGFCVLSPEATFTYKVTGEYAPSCDRGIRWDDPAVGIDWPMTDPLLSTKDACLPFLADADNNFVMYEYEKVE